MIQSPEWIALSREAEVAAELLASGVTALGRANHMQHGYYNQAFFSLSIGLERAAKIAVIVDYCLDHSGSFPTDNTLRACGHDLEVLLGRANEISRKYRSGEEHAEMPDTEIHRGIVQTLSEFAKASRYYNLDYLLGRAPAAAVDPIAAWFSRVGKPILAKHYSSRRHAEDEQQAAALKEFLGDSVAVRSHSEEGKAVDDVGEALRLGARTKAIQRYGRLYTLQIARFLALLLSDMGIVAMKRGVKAVPYLSDFFRVFTGPDHYLLRGRKTWSIYKP